MISQPGAAQASVVSARIRLDRWVIVSLMTAIATATWIYVVVQARQMPMGMSGDSMTGSMQSMAPVWNTAQFGLLLSMWSAMMVAMMLPSAVPMTLIYAAVARKAARESHPVAPTSVFVAGYLVMWGVFSLAATAAQMGLDHISLLSSSMAFASPVLGGGLLIAAGVYELTPLKNACLAQCRAPAHFIAQHWHGGSAGALRMGMALGAYCLGCCWILMALLFVGGVMNLVWIAALAAFILLEKTVPFGVVAGRLVGAAMILTGGLSVAGLIHIA